MPCPSPALPSRRLRRVASTLSLALLVACASTSGIRPRGFPVDALPIAIERFMGDWYVIADIPMSAEAEAYDAVERYALENGTIEVRYQFCDGSPEGPLEEVTMTGWVVDPATGAEWRVRPVWPLRLSYQILELDPDYRTTVVGHPSGSYAWIMAREPSMPEDELAEIRARLEAQGYETERMRHVPHSGGACKASETGA